MRGNFAWVSPTDEDVGASNKWIAIVGPISHTQPHLVRRQLDVLVVGQLLSVAEIAILGLEINDDAG